MAAFYDYLFGLWHNWTWFMTGGPFVAERIAKQIWPRYDAWASRYLSLISRQRLVVGAAIVGIFVASFLAFSDERAQFIIARQTVDRVSNRRERIYQPIQEKQFQKLTELLKPLLDPQEWAGVGVVDNPSAAKLAQKFTKAIREAGGVSTMTATIDDNIEESGVIIFVRRPNVPNQHDQKVIEAFRLSNIPVKVEDLESGDPMPPLVRFSMEVSYPPL